jgi:hypothetical protein
MLYSFRHIWTSLMLIAGVDVLLVTRIAGTSVAMIERAYGQARPGAGGTWAVASGLRANEPSRPFLGRAEERIHSFARCS